MKNDMPFMHIIKLKGNEKWHTFGSGFNMFDTECGISISFTDILEDIRIGGKDNASDPNKKDCCPKCFSFLDL